MAERVLVTGGIGTTGRLVVDLLRERGVEARVATRRPDGPGQARFDWSDRSTFAAALDGATAAYPVAPTGRLDQLAAMRPLLEDAVRRGIGPLVLLSAAALEESGPVMGEVQAWLHAHAPRWVSLRPSWFMQNLVGQQLANIVDDGCPYSAAGDGRMAFIDATDIARVAVAALATPGFPTGEVVLTGPEPLSYDDVARAIAATAGRTVRHCRLSVDQLAERHQRHGFPADYAQLLAGLDAAVAGGSEDRATDGVLRSTGRAPTSLASFLADHRNRFDLPAMRP